MLEQDLYNKIKSSAEEIKVPESLSPDAIKEKLDAVKHEGNLAEEEVQQEKIVRSQPVVSRKRGWDTGKKVVAAAAVLMICGTGVSAAYQSFYGGNSSDTVYEMAEAAEESGAGTLTNGAGAEESNVGTSENGVSASEKARKPKSDAGEMYVIAENYGDIYDLLKEQEESIGYRKYYFETGATMNDGAMVESIEKETAAVGAAMEEAATDTVTFEASVETNILDLTNTTNEGYSKTNVQAEGVDESDIIKTDGSYIYIVDDDVVKVIDIQSPTMEERGEIRVTLASAADRVVEMYVDGDTLNLIVERESTSLEAKDETLADGKNTSAGYPTKNSEAEEPIAYNDIYYVNSNIETELLTYDISNRENPVLKGSTVQDGSYKTSRKVGDIVYLFTQEHIELPNLTKPQAIDESEITKWIPVVNDIAVAADSIYLPKYGNYGLIVSSIDVEKPDEVVDNTLIMNNNVNIYMGATAIYLYNSDYTSDRISTQIAKFSYKDGIIDAVGATSAAGEVYDTFAVNEYQGTLRLLTTDWSTEEENQLYLFDENLKLTASLTGIAKGEQIYAARYFGDMVYFVTYRNTDPLFAVDLSDKENPKILSELKITGFSEYLHFWGEDKLLGIGYETDPETGRQEGLKLSMFDISDPTKLETLGVCVLENIDYSPALYYYKTVLVDAEENIIGFVTESYDRDSSYNYLLFSWEDGKFKELMAERIDGNSDIRNYRGLYVGDTFYVVNTDAVTSYDRENGYQKIHMLEW